MTLEMGWNWCLSQFNPALALYPYRVFFWFKKISGWGNMNVTTWGFPNVKSSPVIISDPCDFPYKIEATSCVTERFYSLGNHLSSSRRVAKQWAGKSHVDDEVDRSSTFRLLGKTGENSLKIYARCLSFWYLVSIEMSSPPKEKPDLKAGHLPAGMSSIS